MEIIKWFWPLLKLFQEHTLGRRLHLHKFFLILKLSAFLLNVCRNVLIVWHVREIRMLFMKKKSIAMASEPCPQIQKHRTHEQTPSKIFWKESSKSIPLQVCYVYNACEITFSILNVKPSSRMEIRLPLMPF